jgi:phenylalanyl-tRNA synthetase beta chain
LHPALVRELDLTQTPILFELLLDPLLEAHVVQVAPVTRFPILVRDLAFVLEASVPAASVLSEIDALRRIDSRMAPVNQVLLFDEYRGKGLENKDKSLAFRFWLQDTERTLSDAQADAAMAAIMERLAHTHGARLRSA